MVMRRWVLAIAVCGLIGAGCGDDGDDGTTAGTGAPKAGAGAGTGATTAGKGGGSAPQLTPADAIAGACDMKDELMMCKGIDGFTECALNECGLQACVDGACKAYQDCVTKAADPCMNSCTRSAACEDCVKNVPDCLIDKCLDELDCD